jgi:putative ABC transport system substrate-binding protein
MDRRTFLAGTGAVLLASPLAAEAQQTGKVYRIAHLSVNAAPNTPETARIWAAYTQGLRELGWVEGQNLAIERRYADGRIERLPDLAAELVALKVDVMTVSAGWAGVRAAKEATKTTNTPIVMTGISYPVAAGFVVSLARPGGNITGLADLSIELAAKRLELLKRALPRVTRVVHLVGPPFGPTVGAQEVAAAAAQKNDLDTAARALGMTLRAVAVKNREDFGNAATAVIGERPDALLVSAHSLMFALRTEIADFLLQQRLPAIAPSREQANSGALMSYNSDNAMIFRRAATYVDKILKGAKPADLPIEQPTKFEFVINLKTAKALGLTIPPSLLGRADQVIQ